MGNSQPSEQLYTKMVVTTMAVQTKKDLLSLLGKHKLAHLATFPYANGMQFSGWYTPADVQVLQALGMTVRPISQATTSVPPINQI